MLNSENNIEERILSIPETYQRYLEILYKISKKRGGWIKNKDIAEAFNILPASVTSMLHNLHAHKLIEWEPKKAIRLTPKGKKISKYLIDVQSLLETFFEKVLHIKSKKTIAKLACDIAHHIPINVKNSLEQFLMEVEGIND
ncbi:MAG: metal-dependent transcriptional regulator [Candidatus Thorarchaeota archaeon]